MSSYLPYQTQDAKRGKGRPRNTETAAQSLAAILNLVRDSGSDTRQEIERKSELGRAVVSDRLATLSELSLIDESKLGTTTGGRAPRLVSFNSNAACVLVATLDHTALGVGLANLSGKLLTEHHEAFDMTNSAEATMNRLETLFEWQRERHAYPVWGICISVPSPVQAAFDDPYLSATPPLLPAWEGFPFVEKLTARFGAPVWLRSSVETMTMGELSAGGGSAIHNMLFVKVGKRIGAGMVLNGQLYRGAQGTAGLIGNLPIRTKDRTAQLEAHAGSEMIATEGWAAATDGRSPILAEILKRSGEISAIDVGQAAQTGDSVSMEIMSRSGRLIGQVVAALANMLNPSLIVLGGSAAQTNDILLAAVREAVYRDSHPLITRDLRISASKLGSSAGLVGAASVVVEALFDAQHLRNWVTGGSPTIAPDFRHVLARAQKMNSFNNIVDEPIPAPPTSIYR